MHILLLTLVVSLAINGAMFLVAYWRQSDKLADISYAVSFIVLAMIALLHGPGARFYNTLLTGMIWIWSVRIGAYLYTLTVLHGWAAIIGLLSPVFITVLLHFVSGVPILEKSADDRWGNIPKYQVYKRRSNLLIPLPKR